MREKFYFLSVTAFLFFIENIHAQNWVNGGNTLTAAGKLGIKSNFSLIFTTANVERGRILNTGNWAIGTTTATSKLTLNSAANASPFKAMINNVAKLQVNSNGGVSIGSATAGPANGLYVNGNVGIGTATPSYKLSVSSTGSVAIYGNGATYGVYGSGGSYGTYGSSSYIGAFGSGSTYGLYGTGSYGVYGSGATYGVFGNGTTYGVYGNGFYAIYGTSAT